MERNRIKRININNINEEKKNIQKQVLLVNKRNNEQIISTHFHKKTSVGTFYP